MSNKFIIELCEEDRARIDRLLTAVESLCPNCDGCVRSAFEWQKSQTAAPVEKVEEPERAVTEAPKTEADEPKEEALPVTPPEEEKPTEEEKAPTPSVQYTQAEVSQKVVALIRAKKKAEVTEVIHEYAANVSDVPPEKYAELMEKLNKL